jgi:hypothetical protein
VTSSESQPRIVDTSFDIRSDAGGKDPDQASPMLRRYHRALWSKALPNGSRFDLDITTPGVYLHHRSELGEFELSSDSIVHPYDYWVRTAELIAQIPQQDIDEFNDVGATVGGFLVFPSNRVPGVQTINGARGTSRSIEDRIDLTLECIRLHYLDRHNPLGKALDAYASFFALFDDFPGYCEFFLLGDLLSADGEVRFFLPFKEFGGPVLPADPAEYEDYRQAVMAFVRARNARIDRLDLSTRD